MKIQIDKFKGRIPKLADHNVPQDSAALASNIRIERNDLRSWQAPLLELAIGVTSPKSLFRYDESAQEHWIWDNASLDFVKTPMASDTWERVYFSGKSEPRYLANDIVGSPFDFATDYKKLGVPAPTTAPTAGGYTTDSNYRAYFYTYVSRYGEEGLPSPLEIITDYDTGNVELTTIATPPADRALKTTVGGYAPKVYLYRTNASTSGTAEFQFVCEARWFEAAHSYVIGDYTIYLNELWICTTNHTGAWNASNFTEGENVADADLGEVCPSEVWNPPDADLQGFTTMANGSVAGFKDNEVHVSIEYLPHAWPQAQIYPVDDTVVGIEPYGTGLVIMTQAFVYLLTGPTSATLNKIKFDTFLPCVSKESIVSTPWGVIYASYLGLVRVTQNGPVDYTHAIMGKEEWSAYVPSTLRGVFYDNKYFGSYTTGQSDQSVWGFIYDMQNENFTESQYYYDASFLSDSDGNMYIVKRHTPSDTNRGIYQWQGQNFNYVQYFWKSKIFILTENVNFSIAEVLVDQKFYVDIIQAIIDSNYLEGLNAAIFATGAIGGAINQETINGDLLVLPYAGTDPRTWANAAGYEVNGDALYNIFNVSMSPDLTFTLYVDDELKFTKTLVDNYDIPFKLPKGFRKKRVQIGLTGYIPVQRVSIATSRKELM